YKAQASIYDATRTRLLQGREDMLALVAAQAKYRQKTGQIPSKPIWVDMGGGTGWNIEQMQQQLDVPTFFHAVYLVDLSTSLCAVARERFNRLGWKNVHVICQDARIFRLSDYETGVDDDKANFSIGKSAYDDHARDSIGADVLTMSYSLSMIPEFHPAIDSVSNLLAPNGIVGVVDFYVQNQVEGVFEGQYTKFYSEVDQEIPFDGGWKPDPNELFVLPNTQTMSDIYLQAVGNPIALAVLDAPNFAAEGIKALGVTRGQGAQKELVLQNFSSRQV
ncbi:MAG: class I SAM-dependent methyltransferase, partial [Cytophagaceae bacterium]